MATGSFKRKVGEEHSSLHGQVIAELRQAILPRLANEQAPDRARYLLSPILFPLESPAGPEAD